MFKSIKNFQLTDFLMMFSLIREFINNGLKLADNNKFIFIQLSVLMGRKFSTLVFSEKERTQIIAAFELYESDGRAHVWTQPLAGLIGFQPKVIWDEDNYVCVFQAMKTMLEKDNRIKNGEVILHEDYVFAAVKSLPVIHQKNVTSGSTTIKLKTAFCIWYLQTTSDAWGPAVGLGYQIRGGMAGWKERSEKVAKNPPEKLKQVSKFTEQKPAAKTGVKPAIVVTKEPSVTDSPVPQTPGQLLPSAPIHKTSRDLPEQIGTALHYLEKALERTFTVQLSNLVSAIRAPQQVAVFPVINQITYKMPKTRGIPMTKMFLPTVRVEVPVKVQSAIPEVLLRELVRKQVEEMLGESSSEKQPNKTAKPVVQTSSAPMQESVVKHTAAAESLDYLKKNSIRHFSNMGDSGGGMIRSGILELIDRRGWSDECSIDKIGARA